MSLAHRIGFSSAFTAGIVRAAVVVAPLGLLAVAAYLQARGVGNLLGEGLASPRTLLAVAGPGTAHAAEAPPSSKTLSSYALLAASATPISVEDGSTAPCGDLYGAPACAGITLATLSTFADPRASLATLRVGVPQGSITVGQGESVLDGRVLFIGVDRVWIERPLAAGGVCQVGLFAAAHAPRPADSGANAGAGLTGAPASSLALRVRSRGEREVEIDRGAVDEIFERAPLLARAVRLAPALGPDGAVRGYTVRGIASGPDGALASALGLRVGDTLLSVNGFGVAKPEELLAAYGRLRGAERIALDIERQGARATLVALTR